jgi:hypothetical protein
MSDARKISCLPADLEADLEAGDVNRYKCSSVNNSRNNSKNNQAANDQVVNKHG